MAARSCSHYSTSISVKEADCLIHSLVHSQASDRVYYVHQTLADAEGALLSSDACSSAPEHSSDSQGIIRSVEAALSDDLNTPQAIALLSEPLKSLNDLLHTKKVRASFLQGFLVYLDSSAFRVCL